MKRRYAYVLLFAVPALLVYGDNPWPAAADTALVLLFALAFLAVLAVLLTLAFRAGRAQEAQAALNPSHLRLAAALSALLVLAIVGWQWRVGNVGARSDGEICADFCLLRGFNGSSMPPRAAGAPTCSCVDPRGAPAVTVPLGEAASALKNNGR